MPVERARKYFICTGAKLAYIQLFACVLFSKQHASFCANRNTSFERQNSWIAFLSKSLERVTAKININYTYRFRLYRAVNILRPGYKNQPVNAVYGDNRCLLSDPYKTHKYTV
jgi:hypothetical protein